VRITVRLETEQIAYREIPPAQFGFAKEPYQSTQILVAESRDVVARDLKHVVTF
jgi:hypothetical protein